jgi:hypothetical protein
MSLRSPAVGARIAAHDDASRRELDDDLPRQCLEREGAPVGASAADEAGGKGRVVDDDPRDACALFVEAHVEEAAELRARLVDHGTAEELGEKHCLASRDAPDVGGEPRVAAREAVGAGGAAQLDDVGDTVELVPADAVVCDRQQSADERTEPSCADAPRHRVTTDHECDGDAHAVSEVELDVVHAAAPLTVGVDELVIEDGQRKVPFHHPCPMFVSTSSGTARRASATTTAR